MWPLRISDLPRTGPRGRCTPTTLRRAGVGHDRRRIARVPAQRRRRRSRTRRPRTPRCRTAGACDTLRRGLVAEQRRFAHQVAQQVDSRFAQGAHAVGKGLQRNVLGGNGWHRELLGQAVVMRFTLTAATSRRPKMAKHSARVTQASGSRRGRQPAQQSGHPRPRATGEERVGNCRAQLAGRLPVAACLRDRLARRPLGAFWAVQRIMLMTSAAQSTAEPADRVPGPAVGPFDECSVGCPPDDPEGDIR